MGRPCKIDRCLRRYAVETEAVLAIEDEYGEFAGDDFAAMCAVVLRYVNL